MIVPAEPVGCSGHRPWEDTVPDAIARLVDELYAGLGKADIEAVLALFDPSVEIRTPDTLPWSSGGYSGLDGAVEYFTSALGHLEDNVFEVTEVRTTEDWAAAIGHWSGRAVASGGTFRVRFVHFWTFRDGKVVLAEGISDTAGILRAFDPA